MIERTQEQQATTNRSFSTDLLPKNVRRVVLHCENYYSLAEVDEAGIWRNPFTKQPINAVIRDWEPI